MAPLFRQTSIVAVVAMAVLFTNLGGPRLWDRDEPRNAGCALEMLTRGDWVTPVFNGELRSHKPVLLYWLMMSAYQLFGVGEFAARFWSATAGVGTALATYAIGRRLFGGVAGMWAGIAVATNLLVGIAGRAATPDSIVIFFSTLSIAVYVYGTFAAPGELDKEAMRPPRPQVPESYFPAKWWQAALLYAVMGMGMLAKGPVGLVLPTAVIGMFILLMRLPVREAEQRTIASRLVACLRPFTPRHFLSTCWSMRPVTAVVVSLMVAAPWYCWVAWRTDGEFLRGFFWEHNVGRAMQTMEGHAGGPLFYPVSILIGFFPWSVFAVPVLIDAVSRVRSADSSRVGYVLAACWVGVYVSAFSLAKTKLPSYVTPCIPGVALATGGFFYHWSLGRVIGPVFWRRLALLVLTVVGIVATVALPIVAHQLLPGEEWLGAVGVIPLLGGLAMWAVTGRRLTAAGATLFPVTAALLTMMSLAVVADRVSRHQENGQLLTTVNQHGNDVRLASFGLLEPTWVFYGRRPVHELHPSGERKWIGNWIEVNRVWRPKPALGVADVLAAPDDWLIITSDDHLEKLTAKLPDDFQVLSDVPYFLKDKRLLLLGRANQGDRIGRSDRGESFVK